MESEFRHADDHWKHFYESDHKWSWSITPLYYLHMLRAVAHGDAEVGFQGDQIPEGMTEDDYSLTNGPIPDLWFQWARPPEKRKFVYPEKKNDGVDEVDEVEGSDLPPCESQKENWDSEDCP